MSAPPMAEQGAIPSLRVLVPYILTFGGGVRTVLGAGLPRLAARSDIRLTYAELCCNDADMDEMERTGVRVDRGAGVPGPSILSGQPGWRRGLNLAGQASRLFRMSWRLSRRMGDYDVCYVHGHRELLLAIAARALARSPRRPAIVWHWHGPPLSLNAGARGSWAGRRIAALGSRCCARVIAISEFCAGQTTRMGVDRHRVVTVLNAAVVRDSTPSRAAPQEPLPERAEGAFVSLVPCASIRPHKGVHVALEALGHLPVHHELWVTGDPADPVARSYVEQLRRMAAKLGAADRVHFLGIRRDVHRVMALSDVVLVPSIWEEPFGLVAAEAQLLGVPVAVSTRGALPELVEGGKLGVVFDVADPRSLAAAIDRLAADTATRTHRADAARRSAVVRYNYDRWCCEIAEVLRNAAASFTRAAEAQTVRDDGAGPGSTVAPRLSRRTQS